MATDWEDLDLDARLMRESRARLLKVPGTFKAEYGGICDACGGPFAAGSPIRADHNGWRAECCL